MCGGAVRLPDTAAFRRRRGIARRVKGVARRGAELASAGYSGYGDFAGGE